MIAERIDRAFNARFYAGEPISIEYQPRTADGLVEPLEGREFILAIRRGDGSIIAAAIGNVIDDPEDPRVLLSLPGTSTVTLAGELGLRYQISETVIDGQDVLVEGSLRIHRAATPEGGAPSVEPEAPVTRITLTALTNRPRIVVTQRGARGATGAGTGVALSQFGGNALSADNTAAFVLAAVSGQPYYVGPGRWKTTVVPAGLPFGPGEIEIISTGEIIALGETPQAYNNNPGDNGERRPNFRLGALAGASWTAQAQANVAIAPRSQRCNETGDRNVTDGWASLEYAKSPSKNTLKGDSAARFSDHFQRNSGIGSNIFKWVGCLRPRETGYDLLDPQWDQRAEWDALWPGWLSNITVDGTYTGALKAGILASGPGDAQYNFAGGRDVWNHGLILVGCTAVGEHGPKGFNNRYATFFGYGTGGHAFLNDQTAGFGALTFNAKMSGGGDAGFGFAVAPILVHGFDNLLGGSNSLPVFNGDSLDKATVDTLVNSNVLWGTNGGPRLKRSTRSALFGHKYAPQAYHLKECAGVGSELFFGVRAAFGCVALGEKAGQGNYSAEFIASVSGTTMIVTEVKSGVIEPGRAPRAPGILPGTVITALGSGTGGVGSYELSQAHPIALGAQTVVLGLSNSNAIGNGVGGLKRDDVTKVGQGCTDATVSGRLASSRLPKSEASAAGTTLLVNQINEAVLTRTGPTAAFSDTLPTAAQILDALVVPEVNTSFEFTIDNQSVGELTLLAPDASVTLAKTTSVAAGWMRRYFAIVTNVGAPAVTIIGLNATSGPGASLTLSVGSTTPLTLERTDSGYQFTMRRAGADRGGVFANTVNTMLVGLGGNGAALGVAANVGDTATPIVQVSTAGRTKINGLGTYASDAAAGAAGLTAAELYKTSAGVLMVKA